MIIRAIEKPFDIILGAINKLLETKKGFVVGAFHKEGLGDIDLVWGNKDYGLEHILKRRIESYIKKGLKPKFAEQRALNLVRMIPEVLEKGKVGRDAQGRLKIETKDILVALRDNWQGEPLKSRWVITGFEKKVGNLREQALNNGINEQQAKEYALNIVKSIPEVLEKGTKGTDSLGRVFVDYGNKRVGLNNEWKNEKLENHWVISSYELYDTEKQALRSTPQAITKEKTFNSLNSVEPNPTTKN
ncbi:hypothetical protein BTM329_07270 [Helicobacter pylori]